MAIVERNGRIYKYKYKRINGKVKRIYDGKGDAALFGGLLEQEAIEEREDERQRLQQWHAEQDELYRAEAQRGRGVLAVMTITLEGLGFRRYSRNPWKRRQMKALPDKTAKKPAAGIEALMPDLLERIFEGDSEALETARKLIEAHPQEVINSIMYYIERLAEAEYACGEVPNDVDGRRDTVATMRLTAAELAGEKPSAAVRLCASAVAFSWIEHWALNMRAGIKRLQDDPVTIRRRNAAHKRFMIGLRTLAQIRRAESATKRTDDSHDWIARFGNPAVNGS
jgi:hypothetical protein